MSLTPPAFGERVTLACSCVAEVVVPLIIFLPRHCVVHVVAPGSNCTASGHAEGARLVVRRSQHGADSVIEDVVTVS